MCLKVITNDLYDIASRLRAVNEDYALYYNTDKSRYEVHDERRGGLAFVVPFEELDARTVDYALYTRVENSKRIFDEVEHNNRRLEKEQISLAAERVAVAYEQGRRLNEG